MAVIAHPIEREHILHQQECRNRMFSLSRNGTDKMCSLIECALFLCRRNGIDERRDCAGSYYDSF
jgi:hypothetical protein